MSARYTVVDVEEVEPAGPGGGVRFLRRAVGATAFGFNWFELGPGSEGPEHDETDSKQEEVMIVLSGEGTLSVDGEALPLAPRQVVRLVLWRLDDRTPPVEELRDRVDELEPLPPPSTFLVNGAAEQIGVLVVAEDDEPALPQLAALRDLVGRDPDLYEEYETLA